MINLLHTSKYDSDICNKVLKNIKDSDIKIYNNCEDIDNIEFTNYNTCVELIINTSDLVIGGTAIKKIVTNYEYGKEKEEDKKENEKKETFHANVLYIDHDNKQIIRFEPHGFATKCPLVDTKLSNLARIVGYNYIDPGKYQHRDGPQMIQNGLELYGTRGCILPAGTCAIWCTYLIHHHIINKHNDFITNYLNFYDQINTKAKANVKISEYISYVTEWYNIFGPRTRSYTSITHNDLFEICTE